MPMMFATVLLLLAAPEPAGTQCTKGDDECFRALFSEWQAQDPTEPKSGPWDNDPSVQALPWGDETPEFYWRNASAYYWIYARDIQHEGTNVTAWIRESRFQPASNGTLRSLTRLTFDCKGRYRYSAQTVVGADDRVIQEIDRLDDWAYVRPDSAYDTYQKALCKQP